MFLKMRAMRTFLRLTSSGRTKVRLSIHGKRPGGYAEQVRDISGSLLLPELDLQHFDSENTDDKELTDAVAGIRLTFEKLQSEMNSNRAAD